MTSIMRIAAVAAAALLFVGPSSAAEKRYGLTSFEKIEITADYIVEVTTRAPVSAVAIGSNDALDRVTIETRDGRLLIGERRYAGDEQSDKPRGPVTIRINAANLESASMVGGGSLTIDRLGGDNVNVWLRGPGRLTVGKLTADRLSIALIGNGTMTLAGVAKSMQATLSGAGALDAGALVADELTADSEGTGDQTFRAVKRAAVTARGVGKTVVLGKPACTVRNIGSGSVECGQGK